MKNKDIMITCRVDKELFKSLKLLADKYAVNRSDYIRMLLAEGAERRTVNSKK
jgi:hypothetical protein